MPVALILIVAFVAVLLLLIGMMVSFRPKHHIEQVRLNDIYKRTKSESKQERKAKVEPKKSNPVVEKLAAKISQFYAKDETKLAKIKESLAHAGYYREDSIKKFLSQRVIGAGTLFSIAVVVALLAGKPIGHAFLIGLLLGFVGYSLPNSRLQAKIRKRQDEIGNSLPDTLDLLVISVEAGMGLNSAILKVGQEMQIRSNAISEELLLVNQEIRAGLSREEALRNLSKRNKNENLRILVSSIIMADKLGSSVADTLRSQSDSLRDRVKQRVEQQAAKAGVKMLFPLVLFILPALFLVILGPGFIMIMKAFSEIN